MVDTMRAERFYAYSKTVAVEDIPIPEPGSGEVLVKVAFCGICHSDLNLINDTFPPQRPVVTQGHEASGTIARLGTGVTGWAEGDRVIVAACRPCTSCPNCRRGDIANCLRIQLMAFAYDGAWAEYTVAQAVGLTRVPDNARSNRPPSWPTRCRHPSARWLAPGSTRSASTRTVPRNASSAAAPPCR